MEFSILIKKAYLPGSELFHVPCDSLDDAVAWAAVRYGTHRITAIDDYSSGEIQEAIARYHQRSKP